MTDIYPQDSFYIRPCPFLSLQLLCKTSMVGTFSSGCPHNEDADCATGVALPFFIRRLVLLTGLHIGD